MSPARWRKVRADLVANKMRSVLAVISLAVGTSAVGGMVLAGTMVDESFETSRSQANPPSAVLRTSPFPSDLVDELADHPAVAQVDGRRLHQAQVTGPDGQRVSVELVAMDDFAANDVAHIDSVRGTWPPEAGEIVLERATVAEVGAEPGETVAVARPGRPRLELEVAGSAFDAYEVAPMLGGTARGYVDTATMVELTGSDHLDAIYLRATDQPETRQGASQMTAAVREEVLDPAGVTVEFSAVDDPGEHPAETAISFITLAMQVLSLLALAVAVTLVVNTVAALLAQQRTQIGVMKAVGATSRHLTIQYLAYVAALSLVAVAVSVPVSLLLGRGVAGFVAMLANIELISIGFPLLVIGLQVAIAALLPIAAVLLAVRRASRTTVREAITDLGLTGAGAGGAGVSRLARPTVLAYRNAVRNRLRLGLTVLTVALSGAVIVGVSSTGGALSDLGDQVAGYSDYDVELSLTSPTSTDEVSEILGRDDEVVSVEGWLDSQALRVRPDGTESQRIDLTGLPVGSDAISPTLLEGRWLEAGDDHAIVINVDVADEEPDLGIGDRVVLEVEGTRREWRIVGISTTTTVGPVAYVPVDDLAALTGDPGDSNRAAVQLDPGADREVGAERLAALAREQGLPVGQVQTHDEIREAVDSLFLIAVALLLVVGAIMGVVGVVGVAGTMTLSVVEQTREIGVLRTLGATTWAVRRLLLLQGLAIAAAGGVVGILLSVPVALLLGAALEATLISAALPFSLSWLAIGIWVVVAVSIGALGATQPARVASRLTIRDTLVYE